MDKPSQAVRSLAAALPAGREAPRAGRESWADLDVLCLTAMHLDPKRRYASVEALIRDLDRYARNEPLEARSDTFRYRAGKFFARNRSEVLAAAAALLVIVALLAFNSYRLASARNAALAEAARTQRIQRFMLDLFEGGDPEAGPSEDLRVVTLVDRGVRTARALDAEPAVQGEMLMTLGSVYEKLGDLEKADGLLQSALDRQRELHGPEHSAVADSLVSLGLLRYAQARLDDAEPLVREGLEMACRTNPKGHPACGRAYVALGKVLQDRGEYDEGIAVLEEAVERMSGEDASEGDLSAAVTELANTHFYAGNYDESESLNQRALEIDRRLHGERHPNIADGLINLGAIEFQRGRYAEAEELDRQAFEIFEEWYGSDHPETASALTVLGRAISYQKRYDEAGALLERALAIQERVYGPVHPRVASALNEIAIVALGHDDYATAEALFGRMAAIYREVYGDPHALVATALSNLASVQLNRGNHAAAEVSFRDVVARYTEAVSADDLNTGIARIKLGRSLLRQEKYAEAVEESLAGYRIVKKLVDPESGWLKAASKDLVAGYEGMGMKEEAKPWRVAAPAAGGS